MELDSVKGYFEQLSILTLVLMLEKLFKELTLSNSTSRVESSRCFNKGVHQQADVDLIGLDFLLVKLIQVEAVKEDLLVK